MKLEQYDPKAIHVEDRRGTKVEPESWWDTIVRGVGNNWQNNGLAGLFGIRAAPAPVRGFDGSVYNLDVPKLIATPPPSSPWADAWEGGDHTAIMTEMGMFGPRRVATPTRRSPK